MKRIKFLALREEIKRKRKSPMELWSYKVGRRREQRTAVVLQEMKDEGLIRDFLPAGDLSFSDIEKGIDFFVVYIGSTKYRICPLSVTGEEWVQKHRDQHPEIPIIAINLSDTSASIKSKIMEVINSKKAL